MRCYSFAMSLDDHLGLLQNICNKCDVWPPFWPCVGVNAGPQPCHGDRGPKALVYSVTLLPLKRLYSQQRHHTAH
jgi:hypothetical protein